MVKDFTKNNDTVIKPATTAPDHSFKTQYNTIVIKETQANIYQNCFDKALFTTNIEREDINKALACLIMQIRDPDEDDWNKLV